MNFVLIWMGTFIKLPTSFVETSSLFHENKEETAKIVTNLPSSFLKNIEFLVFSEPKLLQQPS